MNYYPMSTSEREDNHFINRINFNFCCLLPLRLPGIGGIHLPFDDISGSNLTVVGKSPNLFTIISHWINPLYDANITIDKDFNDPFIHKNIEIQGLIIFYGIGHGLFQVSTC